MIIFLGIVIWLVPVFFQSLLIIGPDSSGIQSLYWNVACYSNGSAFICDMVISPFSFRYLPFVMHTVFIILCPREFLFWSCLCGTLYAFYAVSDIVFYCFVKFCWKYFLSLWPGLFSSSWFAYFHSFLNFLWLIIYFFYFLFKTLHSHFHLIHDVGEAFLWAFCLLKFFILRFFFQFGSSSDILSLYWILI